eukprot:IDg21999t1
MCRRRTTHFEKITENIDYIELLPSACERKLRRIRRPAWEQARLLRHCQTQRICVYISGTRANPLVIHANYNSDRLKLELPNMTLEELMAAYGKHQFMQYTRFYGNFASKPNEDKIIGEKVPVSVYDPEFYLSRGNLATMYGVRKDCGWKFYFNLDTGTTNVTAELWPAIVNTIPVPEPSDARGFTIKTD